MILPPNAQPRDWPLGGAATSRVWPKTKSPKTPQEGPLHEQEQWN